MDRRRMTILIIAEKPSVAQGLAKHFGNARRQDGYLSTGPYLITWCFGHLMELAEPQVYDERYQKWRAADLPILRDYTPKRSTAMVDWSPSEFSRIRLQYARDQTRPGVTDDQVWVHYIMSLGAHGAHKF